ncbi:MAG: SCO family protein [Deltaproteobacteria bacterium]|nr:SCO family protein [Deltaproteobacteria bacterium]
MKLHHLFFALFFVLVSISAFAAESLPVELEGVGITEHPGKSISLDVPFTDEEGNELPLSTYFDGKRPVILIFAYYECPNLCGLLLNGFSQTLSQMLWTVGDKFQVVTLSIDPKETSDLAGAKKKAYLEKYGRPQAANGWHFLTGQEENIRKIADQAGFGFKYDADQKQFAHGAGIFVLTPDGKISRTLYGIEFNPRDVKLALLEAANGKIGNVVDKLLLFCYHYDPKGRKYALFATSLMKAGGGVTVLALGLFVANLVRKKNVKGQISNAK